MKNKIVLWISLATALLAVLVLLNTFVMEIHPLIIVAIVCGVTGAVIALTGKKPKDEDKRR